MTYATEYPADLRRERRVVLGALGVSSALHATLAILMLLLRVDFSHRPHRLTDVSAPSVLVFTVRPEPPPVAPPLPQVAQQPQDSPNPGPRQEVQAKTPQRDENFGAPAPVTTLITDPEPAERRSLIADAPTPGPGDGGGLPAPPVAQPKASFAGVEASPARRIVYLIDASGAMTSSLKFVKEELARSVGRLDEEQLFQVVVFRQPISAASRAVAYFYLPHGEPAMTGASPQAKVDLVRWLEDVQPSGRSEPLVGLEAALRLQPDIVFLLTRGIQRSAGFDARANIERVLEVLENINPREAGSTRRRSFIKTIQFLEDDPTGLMQAVADAHGDGPGSYRVITRVDVNQIRRKAEQSQ